MVVGTRLVGERTASPRLRAYIALALGILFIGFSAIFTKWAEVPGPVSGFYRVLISTVVLAIPFALHTARQNGKRAGQGTEPHTVRGRRITPVAIGLSSLAGLFFALDLGFWNTSLEYTSAANATLLGNTSTLWVSLGAMLFFNEKLKRRFWLGMLISLVGVSVVLGRDVIAHPQLGLGDLLAVVSSVFYAGYLLNTQRVRRYLGTLPFMWLSSVAAAVLLFIYVVAMGHNLWGFSFDTWAALLALGLISHVLGWLAINYALGHLPAPLTAVSLLAQPVLTAILAWPLLNETISAYQIVGGVLVLAGIYIVNRR